MINRSMLGAFGLSHISDIHKELAEEFQRVTKAESARSQEG
jgi:hypothetical protein